MFKRFFKNDILVRLKHYGEFSCLPYKVATPLVDATSQSVYGKKILYFFVSVIHKHQLTKKRCTMYW